MKNEFFAQYSNVLCALAWAMVWGTFVGVLLLVVLTTE